MKYILCSLFALLFALNIEAKKSDDSFFIKVQMSNKDNAIYEGDSSLFSVWIYATHPIAEVECKNENIKIGNCHVRLIKNRQYSQNKTVVENKVYYRYLWAQYVIGSDKKGEYTFPALDFNATLYIEKQRDIDPFDPFGFFNEPSYDKQKKSGSSESFKFKVTTEPLKSMQELMKSGKTLI